MRHTRHCRPRHLPGQRPRFFPLGTPSTSWKCKQRWQLRTSKYCSIQNVARWLRLNHIQSSQRMFASGLKIARTLHVPNCAFRNKFPKPKQRSIIFAKPELLLKHNFPNRCSIPKQFVHHQTISRNNFHKQFIGIKRISSS